MTRALFRKQMMEVFSWLYQDRKTGKLRRTGGIAACALFYLALFAFLGVIFFAMGKLLCAPLLSAGMGWLYWCLMGLTGLFLGVFGSVFNTYSSLYQSRDNDMLLSMPIPVSRILLVRLSGVYAMGLMYELIVMIPALAVWFLTVPVTVGGVLCALAVPLLLSVLALVFSAVLGWVVALIAGRLKHKNILTVVVSVLFIVAYYALYSQAYHVLQSILQTPDAVGRLMQSYLYPLYQLGLAAEGNGLSLLIFFGISGGLCVLTYAILARSFLRLATSNRGEKKAVRQKSRIAVGSLPGALLKKELRRFLGSPVYMLNSGMGLIFMPLIAVVLIWKADSLKELLALVPGNLMPLIALGCICMAAAMNSITAPSVSLEGKSLWLLHTMPVTGRQVLAAKLKAHLLLTVLPALFLLAVLEWLMKPALLFVLLLPVAAGLFILLLACVGLTANLKLPNFNWTSEIVPVKQGAPTGISLFGGWMLVAVLTGGYFLLRNIVSAEAYFLLVCLLLLAGCAALLRWLATRGAELFENL